MSKLSLSKISNVHYDNDNDNNIETTSMNKIFDTNDKPVRVEENKGEDVSKSNVEIVNELFASNQSKVDI